MLHVVSGDAVAGLIRRWAGEPRLLVWRDALYEGPLFPAETLEALTSARAAYWSGFEAESGNPLIERDRQARRIVARDSLWLWFQDNLHDQLQLIQILDFLDREGLTRGPHFLVPIPRELRVEDMAGLAAAKVRLGPEQFAAARTAWQAVCQGSPETLTAEALAPLPDLAPAIARLLEHRPGNYRVERVIRELLAERGGATAGQLFAAYQLTEERPFLGDAVFYHYLDRVAVRDERGNYRLPAGE